MTWIAEHSVVFVQPDGTRIAGRIAIAAPIAREADCACEVAIAGIEPDRMILGASTMQALSLALRFLGTRLRDLRSRGTQLEIDGELASDAHIAAIVG